ncbi:MAG TPA: hypothetical protein VN512_10575 [Clostridia bacterium]|nr:hypothetical protein [Clostridia bacterium]
MSASFGVKTTDTELAAGDFVALWLKHDRSVGDDFTRTIYLSGFSVAILAPGMQSLINEIIVLR